jgi:hypothetical protein
VIRKGHLKYLVNKTDPLEHIVDVLYDLVVHKLEFVFKQVHLVQLALEVDFEQTVAVIVNRLLLKLVLPVALLDQFALFS